MEDDNWRQDGSFKELRGSTARKKEKGKGGLTYTRIVPKFLQKYQQQNETPSLSIDAKFPMKRGHASRNDDDDELDEVQKKALEDYAELNRKKEVEVSESNLKVASDVSKRKSTEEQKDTIKPKKSKTRPLKNKNLLSFDTD